MAKRLSVLILTLVLLMSLLSGCSEPSLPTIDLDKSSLTCTVTSISDDGTLSVVVSQGDSHYDGPYVNSDGEDVEGETILVTYTSVKGGKTVAVGDTISFTYHYTADVSKFNGKPRISVDQIKVE